MEVILYIVLAAVAAYLIYHLAIRKKAEVSTPSSGYTYGGGRGSFGDNHTREH